MFLIGRRILRIYAREQGTDRRTPVDRLENEPFPEKGRWVDWRDAVIRQPGSAENAGFVRLQLLLMISRSPAAFSVWRKWTVAACSMTVPAEGSSS